MMVKSSSAAIVLPTLLLLIRLNVKFVDAASTTDETATLRTTTTTTRRTTTVTTTTTTQDPYFIKQADFDAGLTALFQEAGEEPNGPKRTLLNEHIAKNSDYKKMVELELLIREKSAKGIGDKCKNFPEPPTVTNIKTGLGDYIKWQKDVFLNGSSYCSEVGLLRCTENGCACGLSSLNSGSGTPARCKVKDSTLCEPPHMEAYMTSMNFKNPLFSSHAITSPWQFAFSPKPLTCSDNSMCSTGGLFFSRNLAHRVCLTSSPNNVDTLTSNLVASFNVPRGGNCVPGSEDQLFRPSMEEVAVFDKRLQVLTNLGASKFCNFAGNTICSKSTSTCECLPGLEAGEVSNAKKECVLRVPSACDTPLPPSPILSNPANIELPKLVFQTPECGYGECRTYGTQKDCSCPKDFYGPKCDQPESEFSKGIVGPDMWPTSDRKLRHDLIRAFSENIKKMTDRMNLKKEGSLCPSVEDKYVDDILDFLMESKRGTAGKSASKLKGLLEKSTDAVSTNKNFCSRIALLECSSTGKCECKQSHSVWDTRLPAAEQECRLRESEVCTKESDCGVKTPANTLYNPSCVTPLLCSLHVHERSNQLTCQESAKIAGNINDLRNELYKEKIYPALRIKLRRKCNVTQEKTRDDTFGRFDEVFKKNSRSVDACTIKTIQQELKVLNESVHNPYLFEPDVKLRRYCDNRDQAKGERIFCREGKLSGRCRCQRTDGSNRNCVKRSESISILLQSHLKLLFNLMLEGGIIIILANAYFPFNSDN